MDRRRLRIWIDLANAPHVLFFRPILRELEARGHTPVITGRRFATTIDLARVSRLPVTPIGRGYERGRAALLQRAYWFHRVLRLRRFARHQRFDLAASHGSSTQARAAASLGLPTFVTLDYEFVALRAYRDAVCCMLPEALPPEPFEAAGIARRAIRRYRGLKEEVYLAGFQPSGGVRAALGVADDAVMVTVRPASETAHYLRGFGSGLDDRLIERLLGQDGVEVLVLPRTGPQRKRFEARARHYPRFRVVRTVVDGPSLIAASDMVLGGGGTMTREAAVLGVPAVSCFEGPVGAVDRALVCGGRLVIVRHERDLDPIAPTKRTTPLARVPDGGLVSALVDGIVDAAAG